VICITTILVNGFLVLYALESFFPPVSQVFLSVNTSAFLWVWLFIWVFLSCLW